MFWLSLVQIPRANDSPAPNVIDEGCSAMVTAFQQKMAAEEAQQQYRHRGRVVGFLPRVDQVQARTATISRTRRIKARAEALWACLTFNLQQWIRLRRVVAA
jgi:hypothetical protein